MSGDQLNGHHRDARDIARTVIAERHWAVIPLPPRSKKPIGDEWQHLRIAAGEVDDQFARSANVGVLNGTPSGNLADVDLDTPEALALADAFLPETGCTFGRTSKPRSHRLYQVADLGKTEKFLDPVAERAGEMKRAMLLELRSTGTQTVIPGSVHEGTGELIAFDAGADGAPAAVTDEELRAACRELAAATLLARHWCEGVRHEMALALAGMLAHGGWHPDHIERFVDLVASASGDDEAADRARAARDTAEHYAAGGPTTGRPTLEDLIGEAVVKKVKRWLKLRGAGVALQADMDNGKRLVDTYVHLIRYMDDEWYIWDGKRWALDAIGRIFELAKAVVRDLRREHNNDRASIVAGEMRRIRGMIDAASTDPRVRLEAGSFDQRRELFNVQNGTLELDVHTGKVRLREHRQGDLLSKIAAVPYVEGAQDPRLTAYLDYFIATREGEGDDAAFEFDREKLDFLFEVSGHSLAGYPKREAVLNQGPTHSGKSMFNALLVNMGGNYSRSLAYTSLSKDQHPHPGGHRDDIAGLEGTRFVTIDEIPEGFVPDAALFKLMLSGGGTTELREAFGHVHKVVFTHTLWVATNPNFALPAADDAAYERVYKVEFPHTRPRDERDGHAARELVEDPEVLAAFLALCVEGFKRLYKDKGGKIAPPKRVSEATQQLRLDVDPFASFYEDWWEFTGDLSHSVKKSVLWRSVRAYFEEHRMRRLKATDRDEFEKSVERYGGVSITSTAVQGNNPAWQGIRAKEGAALMLALHGRGHEALS